MLRHTPKAMKMRAIPLVGADVSKSIYQLTDLAQRYPMRTFIGGCLTVVGILYYEARVSHRDRVVSPNIKNNLEYDTYDIRDPKERERLTKPYLTTGDVVANARAAAIGMEPPVKERQEARAVRPAGPSGGSDDKPITEIITNLEKIALEEKDPFLRAEMLRAIERETNSMHHTQNSTMMVTSEQLSQREPHWNVRNNERNWSVMARDQQKQKDSYVYRLDRSRDDDFGRHSDKY